MSLGSDLWVRFSETPRPFADLTDVTLADEDTKSILTDLMLIGQSKAMWWQNLQLMQLAVKFANNASGAIWWPNLQLMQLVPSCLQSNFHSMFLS